MRKEIENWWNKAKDDLDKAKILFDNNKYDGAVFYCQQSIEKALKSLFLKSNNKIKRIHDLVELGKDTKLPDALLSYCKEITQSYIYSRYPDIEEPKDIKEIALDFIEHTKEILKWTEEQL